MVKNVIYNLSSLSYVIHSAVFCIDNLSQYFGEIVYLNEK